MKLMPWCILLLAFAVSSCGGKSADLGNGYYLTLNSRGDSALAKDMPGVSRDSGTDFVVYGHIVEYSFDSTFIVLAEKPRDSVPEALHKPYPVANKLFKNSSFRQYYIINKRSQKVSGPFSNAQFRVGLKELKVPAGLELK